MKLAVYIIASGLGGAVVGALLGLGGSLLAEGLRLALATVLALVGCLYGAAEGLGRRPKLLQRDTETPQRWMHAGALSWAVLNGAVIGAGFTTRVGFALWYLVPVGSLLSGSPLVGALVYCVYGTMRAVGGLLIVIAAKRRDFGIISGFLLESKLTAKALTGAALLAISVTTLIAAGI